MKNFLDRLKTRLREYAPDVRGKLRDYAPVVRDKLRASPLLAVFLIAFVPVVLANPVKIGLTLNGLAKTALFAYGGYWCDRLLYPGSRPHALLGIERGAAEKRRAFVVAAWIVAAALIP